MTAISSSSIGLKQISHTSSSVCLGYVLYVAQERRIFKKRDAYYSSSLQQYHTGSWDKTNI